MFAKFFKTRFTALFGDIKSYESVLASKVCKYFLKPLRLKCLLIGEAIWGFLTIIAGKIHHKFTHNP
jgi:hypothetical protein